MNLWLLGWVLFVATIGSQRTFAEEGGTFVLHEYWTCDAHRMEALHQAAVDIWSPIFDSLVLDGKLIGWGHLTPNNAVHYASPDATGVESMPDHGWFAWFETASSEANEAMWEEFGKRLREAHSSEPRPWLYCDGLTNVSYDN